MSTTEDPQIQVKRVVVDGQSGYYEEERIDGRKKTKNGRIQRSAES